MPQYHFNKNAFGSGFELASTINRALERNNLKLVEVIRMGPRFFIAQMKQGRKKVFFKICLERHNKKANHRTTTKSTINEIEFLTFLWKSRNTTLRAGIPHILDAETNDYVWMLRDFTPGHLYNKGESNFLFTDNFFHDTTPDWLITFFGSLHEESGKLPRPLKKKIHSHSLEDYENCIDWKGALENIGRGELVAPAQAALDHYRAAFDDAPRVLTHHEPYSAHIVRDKKGKCHFIDWENIGLNNPLHDLSIIWIRGWNKPRWQEEFLEKLHKHLHDQFRFDHVFAAEMILQSAGNIAYFSSDNITPEEKKIRKKIIPYFTQLIEQYSKN